MFSAGKYKLPLGKKTYIMGILNYTPDSFSDGGLYNTPKKALEYALQMEKDGADIIDLGANSTRPGAEILSAEEELERLKPVIDILENKLNIPVSVDTFYPVCAKYALEHGVSIINDVSGKYNKEIGALIKKYGAGYIIIHNPCGSSETVEYPSGVVTDVRNFLIESVKTALEDGLNKEHICLDPGFGFGKTDKENFEMLKNMDWFRFSGIALLSALSRKRFLGSATGETEPALRDIETAAANVLAVNAGADIIRVHNVPAAVKAARIADATHRE